MAKRHAHTPLIAHVVHRFALGGMERGVINIINNTPPGRCRHAIVSITEITELADSIRKEDVLLKELHKRPGQDPLAYLRLWRWLKKVRPDVVHTRGFGTLETQLWAALAGVRGRIHGEHGRSPTALENSALTQKIVRRCVHPFVRRYTAVSRDIADGLARTLRIPQDGVFPIFNGVDTAKFCPPKAVRSRLGPAGFLTEQAIVVVAVGRMYQVKDHPTLVRAFLHLVEKSSLWRKRLRLVIVGDGPLRKTCQDLLRDAAAGELAWMPGNRADVDEILRGGDVFALPSLGEGMCNAVLEAMATGLPVVATEVGGNAELVEQGRTGMLVPAADPHAFAAALERYVGDENLRVTHGRNGRRRVVSEFALTKMVNNYLDLYDDVLKVAKSVGRRIAPTGSDAGRDAESSGTQKGGGAPEGTDSLHGVSKPA